MKKIKKQPVTLIGYAIGNAGAHKGATHGPKEIKKLLNEKNVNWEAHWPDNISQKDVV